MLYNEFIFKKNVFITGMKYMENFIILFLCKFWEFLPIFHILIFKAFKGGSKVGALV